jgi:hypothetical protein
VHHYVSLRAHQELRDVGRHSAVPRGSQGPQELASTHTVHYDRAVLRTSTAAFMRLNTEHILLQVTHSLSKGPCPVHSEDYLGMLLRFLEAFNQSDLE